MANSQTTKQWLYSIRAISRRRKAIVHEISGIKEEQEAIFDTSHALFGEDAKAAVKPSSVSDPTLRKALILCDNLHKRLDALLFEYERLDLEVQQARDIVNSCFEKGDMSVQEYEVIFYYYFEGMSNEEVAEVTYYSVDWVYKLKASAVKVM